MGRPLRPRPLGHQFLAPACGLALIVAAVASPARAAPSARDLEAVAHTLGFIEGIPHLGTVKVAVIYASSGDANAAARAQEMADTLNRTAGPGSSAIAARAVSIDSLAADSDMFDALLIAPPVNSEPVRIIAEAARRRLVTISTDAACLENRSCVLSVQAEPSVTVTLDTGLAADLGVRISPIFAMMVKRK